MAVPGPVGPGGGDLEQAIKVLQARIDEEFRIAERLDSKARQAFALAAGFFAVVQTVAFGAFAADDVHSGERILLGIVALVAGLAVVWVGHRLNNGEELLEESDIKPEKIVQWANEAGGDREYVTVRLVGELGVTAERRSENNGVRARNYGAVADATRWAMIFAGAELIAAIIVRL